MNAPLRPQAAAGTRFAAGTQLAAGIHVAAGAPLAAGASLEDSALSESGTATGRLAVTPWRGRLRGIASGVAGTGAMLFALKLAGCALGLGMHLALARLLGVASYGTFATAFNAATLVAIFAACGMPLTASRFLPRYLGLGKRDLARGYLETAAFTTVAGGLVGGAVLLFSALVLRDEQPELALSLMAASPLVLLLSLAQTATALLQALHRPLAAEFPILVVRPLLVAAACGLLALPALRMLDATTALVVLVLGSAVAFWPTARAIRQTLAPLDLPAKGRRALKDWLAPGALLLLLVGGAALNERLDVMIVSAFVDPAEAGIYSIAARFGALISLGTAAATVRAMPLIAERLAHGDRAGAAKTVAESTRTALALAAIAGIPLFLGAGLLLSLFGPGFDCGATALRLLVTGHAALAAGGAASTALIASGNERRIALVTGAGILVNLALNFVLVPRFGMNGAAAATLATLALTGLGLVLTARQVLGFGVFAGRDLRA